MNKTKKHSLSPEELELFRQSCKEVNPLKNDKLHLKQPKALLNLRRHSLSPMTELSHEWVSACSAEEKLYFARTGLQNKVLNQLRRGHLKIEARIDLHGLTGNEAIEQTEAFLQHAQNRGHKWVQIIHGKGHYSQEGKSILKSLLNEWLPQQDAVLAFASSHAKDGGTGALYVLLKKRA